MMNTNRTYEHIPKEQFAFVNQGERITDKKFEDKPVGYFRDAWNRFCRNRASIAAAIIILCILLFSIVTPLLVNNYDSTFMDVYYSRKPSRNLFLQRFGIADGGTNRDFSEQGLGLV